jgi:hypothetical protein
MKNKYLFRALALFGALCLMLFVTPTAYAGCGNGYANNLQTVSYNKCSGVLSINRFKYYERNSGDPDDKAHYIAVYFWRNNGWELVWHLERKERNAVATPRSEQNEEEQGYWYRNENSGNFSFSRTEEDIANWWRFANLTMGNLPQDIINSGEIKVRLTGSIQACGGGDHAALDQTFTIQIQDINAPSSLTATQNNCSSVDLSWQTPTQFWENGSGCVSTSLYSIEVLRNNSVIATLAGNATSYTDNGGSNGVTYNYNVRMLYRFYNGSNAIYSPNSNTASGKQLDPPAQPSGFSASQNLCNGAINLSWQWTQSNPGNGFKIERGTTAGSYPQNLGTVTGGTRSFVNNATTPSAFPVVKGQVYYYRITAIDHCNRSGQTAEVSGLAPTVPAAATNVQTSVDAVNNRITITWTDNANNETYYTVVRNIVGGGGATIYELDANSTSFTDTEAGSCVNYQYTVKAYNDCTPNGISTAAPSTVALYPNLSGTFTSSKLLTASKGYFPDKIQLEWSNNNSSQLNQFRIYRKQAGANSDSTLITTQTSGSGIYVDLTASAGILYKYTIIGEANCAGTTIYSNIKEDIGFRSPFGLVNGRVTYTGGIAVKDVRVTASGTGVSAGSSVLFTGGTAASTPNKSELSFTTGVTAEFWARPVNLSSGDRTLAKLTNAAGHTIWVYHNNTSLVFRLINTGGTQRTVTVSNALSANTYAQVTCTMKSDSMSVYVNGAWKQTLLLSSYSFLPAGTFKVELGESYQGNLDELRIWSRYKTSTEVTRDFNRFVSPNEAGLVGYWNFDENIPGLFSFYDQSKTGNNFNATHGTLPTSVQWSSIIPGTNVLSNTSYTDANGNYTITNIRFTGNGQTFTITPNYSSANIAHSFTPSTNAIFLGEGAAVLNNVDFTNTSSFEVSGRVVFAKGSNCPSKEVSLKIDGNLVVQNGSVVKTAPDGTFTIQVPIGPHVISVERVNHVFSVGRFPATGTYEFLNPVANVVFRDSTLVKIVGRVVGGARELKKAPGLGRSKNNIGRALIAFRSSASGADGCLHDTVYTDAQTGEYTAYLPPMFYTIPTLKIMSDPTKDLRNISFGNVNTIDLSVMPLQSTSIDTLRLDTVIRIDSTHYHTRLDFKYLVTPRLAVTNQNTPDNQMVNDFTGSQSIDISDSLSINIANNALGYPVFVQSKYYAAKVKVFEQYENTDVSLSDPNRFDYVPVAGTLRFNNGLATPSDAQKQVHIDSGIFEYSFRAGDPNTLRNTINPQYSFTKTIELKFTPDIGTETEWLPNQSDPVNKQYRGIVFGSRSGGANFTSTGPALVDFVLRDPPGSASSATWTSGKAYTKTESWNLANDFGQSVQNTVHLGTDLITFAGLGVGVITDLSTTFDVSLGLTFGQSINEEGELVTTSTQNTTLSTGSDPGSVGAGADIYYGKSTNIIFGNSDVVQLIDTATCRVMTGLAGGTDACFGNQVGGYRIGKQTGFFVVPGTVKTTFAYTQNEILTLIIPELEGLRNQLLTKGTLNTRGQRKYTNLFTDISDDNFSRKYGSNNDDPIWGAQRSTPTPFVREQKDSMGMSYLFRGNTPGETDSIRYFNDQIRLWKNAIARNEQHKYNVFKDSASTAMAGGRNVSIGKASFTQEFTTQVDESYTESFEWNISEEVATEIGFELMGVGNTFAGSLTFEQTRGKSSGSTTSVTNTFAYTLQDGDDGDLISVDVIDPKNGDGHIFKLRAGRTSCPYEGKVTSMFFDPDNDTITSTTLLDNGFEIQPATAQNDVPDINIGQTMIFNVPANEEAIFTLELGNLSEGHQDRSYALRVDEASNPYGAIIKVDGLDPNRSFNVPYGTALQKTLTVTRGPNHYDYENIKLILKSDCDDDIFDTISISVKFLPTCTSVSLLAPDDRWVLNNSFRDTFPVTIGGYNYNFGGFNNIKYQYKAASSSQWLTLQNFDKDTASVVRPGVEMPIPVGQPYVNYSWITNTIPDGNYEIRAVTECIAPGYPNTFVYSPILQGVVDRVNPAPFGSPSPADGILEPNDEISIQFNELIDNSSLTLGNFDIRGVLNGSNLQTNTSLFFDGNGDYIELPTGLSFINKPFTLELMAKRGTLGQDQCLLSQGVDAEQNIWFGFNAANKLVFKVGSETVESQNAYINQTTFSNYAVSFDPASDRVYLYVNGVLANPGSTFLYSDYNGSGKMFVGKSSTGAERAYNGNMLELRIWSVSRTTAQIQANLTKTLTGREVGIMGNWRIDEAEGTQVRDVIRARHGNITGAVWQITPSGNSYAFNGTDGRLAVSSGNMAITREMDFTVEFWLKSSQSTAAVLFSNGKGDSTDASPEIAWSIEKTTSGQLVLRHLGATYILVDSGLFDGNWHHFAMALQRSSNLSTYLDGELQKSYLPGVFKEFSGPRVSLGARTWINGVVVNYDNYFNGNMDEVRFWNISRTQELIRRDKVNRLSGNEPGLSMYIPFEHYALDPTGVPILTPSINDAADNTHVSVTAGGASFNSQTPTIKLPRPVQSIAFNYAVNNDRIILTPTIDPAYIENVTLDITVKDVYDLRGNKMQSPKTWIAYVNKNQVKWQDQELSFTKQTLAPLTFTSTIVNSGGALKTFNLGSLPAWLTANPSTGTVSPNSVKQVTFTVNPTVNIGTYEEAISLLTDFGFPEKLVIKLKVFAPEPNWVVDESRYQNSMSVVGQLRIGNVLSSNTDNILAAFIDDECRGKAKLQYFPSLDRYLVFLDIFGDSNNQTVKFKIWNAAEGKLHDEVTPELTFIANDLAGNIQSPVIFNADDKLIRTVALNNGWNWLSFNLNMRDSNDLNRLFSKLKLDGGEMIRSQVMIADYSKANGWLGSLNAPSAGVKPNISYRFRSVGTDTLTMSGVEVNPQTTPVPVVTGWNWIGFISQRNMSTSEAFSNYVPVHGELIKSQTSFAIYDSTLGWVGSLNTLRPNLGYMYQAKANGTLYYPRAGMFGKKADKEEAVSSRWPVNYPEHESNMSMIVYSTTCTNLQQSGELLLGAYVNNELRGIAKAKQYGGRWAYFLTVGGDKENETITFKLMNEATGKTYACNETHAFVSNQLLGKTSDPVMVTTGANVNCTSVQGSATSGFSFTVYPNPANDAHQVKLGINLPADDVVEVSVFDINGRMISSYTTARLTAGYQLLPVFGSDVNPANGVYIINIKTAAEVAQTKFIKQ